MHSNRTWSLLDMMKLFAPNVLSAVYNMGLIAERFVLQTDGQDNKVAVSRGTVEAVNSSVGALERVAADLKLAVTRDACARCREITDKFQPSGPEQFSIGARDAITLGYLLSNLSMTMAAEFRTLTVVCVSAGNGAYLNAAPHFGQQVEDAFPSVAYDIDEASKCRALGRWTACVMHLMRVLEVGLACLAKSVGVDAEENWNRLIDRIESELRKVGKRTHSPEEEQFAAEAATHFRAIKNAWRNHAMHAREKYDEERAVAIYDSTRSFMRHLSQRLSE